MRQASSASGTTPIRHEMALTRGTAIARGAREMKFISLIARDATAGFSAEHARHVSPADS